MRKIYEQEKLRDFLKDKKALSIKKLEEMCSIPQDTLRHFNAGRRNLPKRHFEKIEEVLTEYGYNSIDK